MEQICKQETTKQELTVMDLMIKLGQLNEKLEKMDTENYLLKQEIEQLRNDNIELHNRLNENINDDTNNNNEGGWTEEEFDIVANAYDMNENFKFV